jgi:glycosyltransferase involved in cell wall biosynthesis
MSGRRVAKPTVLTFVPTYLPGFKGGGPIRSIANLVDTLGDEVNFRIVTADRDYGEATPYVVTDSTAWQQVGKARVRYLPPGRGGWLSMLRLLRQGKFDLLYFNSLFHPVFTILPLWFSQTRFAHSAPIILAPRGELSLGALSMQSSRKRLFLTTARLARLHRNIVWHASSEHESEDIRRVFKEGAKTVHVAPAIPRIPSALIPPRAPKGPELPLRVVFLARIVPMKNLLFALEVLAQVRARVEFSIYGPEEDASYWALCRAAIHRLPANVHVTAYGAVRESAVPTVLRDHDLLFSPTLGENFGHTIAEALSVGLPVLISDRTMWRGLAAEGVGYDLPLTEPGQFVRAIEVESASSSVPRAPQLCQAYLSRKLRLVDLRAANRALFIP